MRPCDGGTSKGRDESRPYRAAQNEVHAETEGMPVATEAIRRLVCDLHSIDAIKFGRFRLKDGRTSPVYVDLRVLVSHPEVLRDVAAALLEAAQPLEFDRVSGIPYAGLPLAVAVSLEGGVPMVYARKEKHQTGTARMVEGEYEEGDVVLLVDDVITSGRSKIEGIEPLEARGLKVNDLLVLIDRQQGGKESVEAAGYKLHSVMTIREALGILREEGRVSPEVHEECMRFLGADRQE